MAVLIEASGLKKRFGEIVAVDGISLSVARGEVLGFLGPNGAGKSTTMKMLTGFLEPDAGSARVADIDVFEHPKLAKSKLGYLPEGAPCYGDMTARAFLNFIAEIRGFDGEEAKRRVAAAVDKTELASVLEQRGIEVSYAIHPVAGRMPGHMNVLLAEANVPYPLLKEMDEINPEFSRADVALVVGANDVTNPAARRPGTAISGMPILDVDQAKSIIVIKRSMASGYAGIDNELYVDPKTSMYFADAKKALTELTAAVKTLVG